MPHSLLDQFAALGEGLEATTTTIEDDPFDFSSYHPGPLDARLDQLEVIAQDTLYSQFVLDINDPQIVNFGNVLLSLGRQADKMIVWPTNRVKVLGSVRLRIYQVIHDPYQFAAYSAVIKQHEKTVPCELPTASDIGEVLLARLGMRQHQRPQSLWERAKLVRHLRDECGKNNAQIAAKLAYSSEDGTAPSDGTVSQLYSIGGLPDEVGIDIHRGILKYSHARALYGIANDANLCILFAMWATQGQETIPATLLEKRIADVLEKRYDIRLMSSGRVSCEPIGALKLVSDQPQGRVTLYYPQWAAETKQVSHYMRQFQPNIVLVAGNTPEQTAITPQSLGAFIAQLSTYKGNMPLTTLEAMGEGFLEAVHRAAVEGNFTNSQGILKPESEGKTEVA